MSKKLTFFLLFAAIVLLPIGASAAIVPQAPSGGAAGQPLHACDLLTLYNNVLQFGIYIATVIATLMLTYAGFLYVTSSAKIGNIEKAHEIFRNVLIGFIIVLVAWMIVSTLLRVFTNQPNFNPFTAIQCTLPSPVIPGGSTMNSGTAVLRPDIPMPDSLDETQRDSENFWRDQGYNCIARSTEGICTQFQNAQNAADGVRCLSYDAQDQVCNQWSDDPEASSLSAGLLTGGGVCTPGDACAPLATQEDLGTFANYAASICQHESRGIPNVTDYYRDVLNREATDILVTDSSSAETSPNGSQIRRPFSIGVFQINMFNFTSANPLTCDGQQLACSNAFVKPSAAQLPECVQKINQITALRNIGAQNLVLSNYCSTLNPTQVSLYDQCRTLLNDPSCSATVAKRQLYDRSGLSPWARVVTDCRL